jgi:hypothetical protein
MGLSLMGLNTYSNRLLSGLFAAYYLLLSSHWPGPVPSAGLTEVPPGREDGSPLLGLH